MIDRERWNRLSGPLIWLMVGFGVLWLVWSGSLDFRDWNPLRKVPPPTTIERVARLRQEFFQGNWRAALSESDALRNDLPDDPERMRIEASCLLRLGRAKESADVLRRLVDKDSSDMTIRLALALALMQSGSADEARTVLEMVRRHPVATAEIREQAMGMLVRLDGLEPPGEADSGSLAVEKKEKRDRSRRNDQSIVDALGGFETPGWKESPADGALGDGSVPGGPDGGAVPQDGMGLGGDGNSGVGQGDDSGDTAGGTPRDAGSDPERMDQSIRRGSGG